MLRLVQLVFIIFSIWFIWPAQKEYVERLRPPYTPRTPLITEKTSLCSFTPLIFSDVGIPNSLRGYITPLPPHSSKPMRRAIRSSVNQFRSLQQLGQRKQKELGDVHLNPHEHNTTLPPPSSGFIFHRTQLWKIRSENTQKPLELRSAFGTIAITGKSLLQ
jgi:hypothetical protein